MSLGMGLIAFVDGVFMSLVILITLFMSYGRVGLLIVLPLPLLTVLALVLGRLLGPLFFKVQEHYARISDHVQETLSGIRVVKSFVKEKKTLDDFSLINAEYGRANMNLARFWGFMFPAMHFLAGLGVLLLLYFGGRHVLADTLSYGDFVAMLAYLGMLIWPAMGAGWVVNMLQRGAASMKRINSVLDEVPDITDMDAAVDVPPVGGLEFRSVCYAYQSNDKVLKNISFTVPEGRAMGILGRTGSGKNHSGQADSPSAGPAARQYIYLGAGIFEHLLDPHCGSPWELSRRIFFCFPPASVKTWFSQGRRLHGTRWTRRCTLPDLKKICPGFPMVWKPWWAKRGLPCPVVRNSALPLPGQ